MEKQKFYVQLGDDNRVTDIIEYAYGDYVETELPVPLPIGAYSGEWQLVDGELVHRDDWVLPADENGSVIAEDDTEGQLRLAERQLLAILDRERIDAALGIVAVKPMTFGLTEKDLLIEKIRELRQKLSETQA